MSLACRGNAQSRCTTIEASQMSLQTMILSKRRLELSQPWEQIIPHPLHAPTHACILLHARAHDAAG